MNTKKSASFFTEEENTRIRTAIGMAEANTSGEIVTMVVDRSDSYREAEILGAVLTAAFCGFLLEIALQAGFLWFSTSGWETDCGDHIASHRPAAGQSLLR